MKSPICRVSPFSTTLFAFTLGAVLLMLSPTWAAKPGGSFVINIGAEPTTLNPVTSTDGYATDVQSYILESLLDRDVDTYEWKPALAEKWEISKDGKLFTFTLRQGVQWQDGKPLTADDVKFSFDVIFDPKFPTAHKRPYYEQIEKVEVVDSTTVRFTTKSKYFLNFDIAAGMAIVPKHIYGDPNAKNLNKTLTGSGPYKLGTYDKGKRIVLERNPTWWGNERAKKEGEHNFDKIILKFVKEEDVSLEMLKKGEIDYMGFGPEMYSKKTNGPEWGKKVLKVKTENQSAVGYGFVAMNFKRDIFQDVQVRKGLAHLFNRKMMIEKFFDNLSMPATGPFYSKSEYASPKVAAIDFDPTKALELFRKAGWTDSDKNGILDKTINGTKQELKFQIVNASEDFNKFLTIFKEDAKKAGVQIEIKLVEWNTLLKLTDEGNFDAITLAWGGGGIEWDPKQIWHSASAVKGGSNFISYKNPEVDKLIDQAREELDKKKRIPLLQKVYELIANDAPYIFMFNRKFVMYGHTPKIKRPKDTFKYGVGTSFWWIE